MRIVHLTDCYLPRLGGIEVQVHDLARHQRAAGHQVEVVTATPLARHDRTLRQVIDGVVVHRASADLPFQLPVHPRAGREVARLLRAGGYDVAQVHAGVVSPFAWSAALAATRARVPTAVTVHCLWDYVSPAFAALDRVVGWSRWPVALSAVSEVAAAPLRCIAGPGVPVDVLPNGIDPGLWRVVPAERDPDDVRLVSVMRLAPRKRPLALLRVLREVRARLPRRVRLAMTVIGEGPERRTLERYLAHHGMDGWVELAGRRTRGQIRDAYRRADVFVTAADLESFGIAALEARSAGLPVAAKARGGVRDFVAHGREGWLAGTDADLVEGVARLCADPGMRAAIATHNRAVAPAVTWEAVLERTSATYARAAAIVAAAR